MTGDNEIPNIDTLSISNHLQLKVLIKIIENISDAQKIITETMKDIFNLIKSVDNKLNKIWNDI